MEITAVQDAPSTQKSTFTIEKFDGIDLSSSPTQISECRSPNAPNMIKDLLGKPVKRTGFEKVCNYGARINGRYEILEHEVIHAGTKYYLDGRVAFTGAKDAISTGQVIGDKLYIFDGEEPVICDGEDIYPLDDDAYVPTAFISKNPSGGGTAYEDINMLSPKWIDSFTVTSAEATATEFQLSFDKLSKGKVKVEVLDSEGVWQEKTEDTDFTVNRETGTVTFVTAPGESPVAGEDSVKITASRYFEGYYERVANCNLTIAYNQNGTRNRLFIAGNPDYPARDYWSQVDKPEYFPDLNYSVLGEGDTKIIGYSVLEGQLATHITPSYDGRSILLRALNVDEDSRATFPVTTVMQGEEAIASRSFVFMESEPLFITRKGVFAITPADIDGRKYTQNRSYYINKVLTASTGLANAYCTQFRNYYVISLDQKLFLLDTAQKGYQKNEPMSNFQYECYEWEGIDGRVVWENNGVLYFGDTKGNVCRFIEDTESPSSYVDFNPDDEENPKAITAYWTIPDFSGKEFWRNKTIRTVAISCAQFPQNKIVLKKQVNGVWEDLKEWSPEISYFNWNAIDWSNFTWSGNSSYRTITAKIKIKKFDKCGFRIECNDKYKAFGLYGFAVEFTESGRYKK